MTGYSGAMSIEQARAAFDRADPPTGLARLLEAWRTLRLPRLADLIQHVSDALVATAPPIEGKTEIAYVEAFEALAPGDPVDLGRFLARSWPCKSTHLANLWLRATSNRPDDPRLTAAITRSASSSVPWAASTSAAGHSWHTRPRR